MSLEPAAELLRYARRNHFAIGYFESWDLASLEGTIDAAERSRAPAILGFNGEFLSRPQRDPAARLESYAAMARAAAESARVPCAVMFNECSSDAWVRRAIDAGFNMVMLADPAAELSDLTRRVAEIVRLAHSREVAVEAELGLLPAGSEGHGEAAGSLTDPAAAAEFIGQTGADVLAVSAGNIHVLLAGQRPLDLERLSAIAQRVEVPLALHGGTGIESDSLRAAVALGVAKVNFGTYLKQHVLAAWRRALPGDVADPHRLLGDGGESDLLVIARRAVCDAVLERIETLGCVGRA